jgi:hypothetical protein
MLCEQLAAVEPTCVCQSNTSCMPHRLREPAVGWHMYAPKQLAAKVRACCTAKWAHNNERNSTRHMESHPQDQSSQSCNQPNMPLRKAK